jgi:hypothetical protein
MLVMAIVILAIIFIQARALTTNADSNSRQQATTYANEAMEQMRSIPWFVLERGLRSNYLAAGSAVLGGSDPLVAGNVLNVEGTSVPLVVATAGAGSDQNLAKPWSPVFDSSGSNIAIKLDPSGRGDEYVVKSYVTKDQLGNDQARGLAVVVEWNRRTDGETDRTVLFSTAYAPKGGCGDLNNAPFLASCQAQFYSGSSSANVVMSASASVPETPDDPGSNADTGKPLPILPGSSFYTFQMSTSGVAARASSQQVTTTDSYVRFGGTTRDDNLSSTQAEEKGWTSGYGSFTLRASDDTVSTDAPPPNPTDVTASATNTASSVGSAPLVGMSLDARSDDTRNGTLDASVTQACNTGVGAAQVPASDPCSSAKLAGSTSKSGFMEFNLGSQKLSLGQVQHSSGTTSETAWAGRFSAAVLGNSVTGCQVLATAGCVSAGADRSIGDISIGKVLTGGGVWDDGDAASGLVMINGYHDRVGVQRGSQQVAAVPTLERSATVQYWTASGYQNVSASVNQSTSKSIEPVTWTTLFATVTASGSVNVAPSATDTGDSTDPQCKKVACEINASNGNITVNISYLVTPLNPLVEPFELSVTTQVNGSTAAASYKEPEDNA